MSVMGIPVPEREREQGPEASGRGLSGKGGPDGDFPGREEAGARVGRKV